MARNVSMSTLSGVSLFRRAETIPPDMLNTRSDGTLVAAIQSYFCTNVASKGNVAAFLCHQSSGSVSMSHSWTPSYKCNSLSSSCDLEAADAALLVFAVLVDTVILSFLSFQMFANKSFKPDPVFFLLAAGPSSPLSSTNVDKSHGATSGFLSIEDKQPLPPNVVVSMSLKSFCLTLLESPTNVSLNLTSRNVAQSCSTLTLSSTYRVLRSSANTCFISSASAPSLSDTARTANIFHKTGWTHDIVTFFTTQHLWNL